MAPPEPGRRRLIVNADDFGRSPAINEAITAAHRHGILTSASLMVNEPFAADAVARARACPALGVGLHLTLVCGRAALPAEANPGLAGADGQLPVNAVRAGWRYFFRRDLRAALRNEIAAQFDAFARTGLPLDHVNGHLNLHLHPVVFRLLLDLAPPRGIHALRLTRDRFRLNARLARGAWAYRLSHAVIFNLLSAWARPRLRRAGVRHTRHVFGLLQSGRVDEAFLLRLLPRLPAGDSELYSHPSLTEFPSEFEALVSPRVRALAAAEGIRFIRYQDL
jgi:hopanoid biosynthesis associated protein HpnK